ncbi:hypothetical protein L5G28_07645 [Gordonia sp. HY285]|uniref:hypothetical protein n=1 Tax=Gordonia liuliyuniae TaxID=2911517 RepID=UPI001F39E011|nr:hypothetical protein [Gordonia liuliyuniae]MCF8610034.1 hypothetical protein [Gordonia liuliyuniae]
MQNVRIGNPAYRHGISEDDILYGYHHRFYIVDGTDDMSIAIGPINDGHGLIEIGFISDTEGGVVILHAMHARRKYVGEMRR